MNKTAISWATHTWNPISGCTKISPGCAHCYAESITLRFRHGPAYLPGVAEVKVHPERLDQPRRVRDGALIFTCSVSDPFHEDVPLGFLEEMFGVMEATPRHQFMLLTKRAERMRGVLARPAWRWPLPNVWLGVSAENQRMADLRVPALLDVPAPIHFVSAEPLLRGLDLARWMRCQGCGGLKDDRIHTGPRRDNPAYEHDYIGIDWLIVGGESGPKARPMHPAWPLSLAAQADEAEIPFHFKQWGTWGPWRGRGEAIAVDQRGQVGSKARGRDDDALLWRTRPSPEQELLGGVKRQEWPPYQGAML